MRDEHLADAGEFPHDRIMLGCTHVAGGEDRAVLLHEREDLVRLGEQVVVGVGDDDARTGNAELRRDALFEVLTTAEGRQPHDARTELERDLDGRRVHAADLAVTTDATEHRDVVADVALYCPRQRRGGRVVRLQDDGAVPRRRGLARGFERVDRTLAVRIGTEMTVQVGRAGEVNAHRRGAYA